MRRHSNYFSVFYSSTVIVIPYHYSFIGEGGGRYCFSVIQHPHYKPSNTCRVQSTEGKNKIKFQLVVYLITKTFKVNV